MREGNKIMKKIFSIFILMILFICGAVINVNAYTNNENMNSKEITNIITEAYQYRTKSIVDPSYIDKLELFYAKYTKIYNFEKNRYKNYIEMADRLNIKILNIKSNVEISNIKLKNNDECQVDLKEIISFDWINSNDDPINSKTNKSDMGIDHKVTLIKKDNEWKIQKDEYTEGYLTNVTSPDFDVSQLKSLSVPEITHDNVVPYSPPGSTPYNRNAAANYAENYCLKYNPSYKSYDSVGGDCANFVSQCLYAGGAYYIGFGINSSTNWWYDNKNTSLTTDDVASTTWTYCPSQRPFILSGWGSETTSSSLSRGDIIYYDWAGDGIWDHVAIVTGFDSSGAPLVSCHTTDYHNIKWNYGGSSCKYSCIHINNYI